MNRLHAIAVLLCLLLPLQAMASLAMVGCGGAMDMPAAAMDSSMDCHASPPEAQPQPAGHDCCGDDSSASEPACSHCDLCLQSAPAALVDRSVSVSPALSHRMPAPALRVVLTAFPSSLLRPPQRASRSI